MHNIYYSCIHWWIWDLCWCRSVWSCRHCPALSLSPSYSPLSARESLSQGSPLDLGAGRRKYKSRRREKIEKEICQAGLADAWSQIIYVTPVDLEWYYGAISDCVHVCMYSLELGEHHASWRCPVLQDPPWQWGHWGRCSVVGGSECQGESGLGAQCLMQWQ